MGIIPGAQGHYFPHSPLLLDALPEHRGILAAPALSLLQHLPPDRIYHVTVMPCYDKKLEASRPDFFNQEYQTRDVDCVITTGKQSHRGFPIPAHSGSLTGFPGFNNPLSLAEVGYWSVFTFNSAHHTLVKCRCSLGTALWGLFSWIPKIRALCAWFCSRGSAEAAGARRSVPVRCGSCSPGQHVRTKSHFSNVPFPPGFREFRISQFPFLQDLGSSDFPFSCCFTQLCLPLLWFLVSL